MERGRKLIRYEFRVLEANSQWYVGADPEYRPAYHGTVWADEPEGRLSRIEMEADEFPAKCRIRSAAIQTDFEAVTIDGTNRLLPSHSEVTVFANGGYAERRSIRYSGYRRFSAASRLVLECPE